jgi:hypothetical protein
MNSEIRFGLPCLRNGANHVVACCVTFILTLFFASGCASPQQPVSPDMDAPSLTLLRQLVRDQPEIWRIEFWDGKPMVVTPEGVSVLTADMQIVPKEATPGVALRDAVDSGGSAWAIEPSPREVRLLQFKNGNWRADHSFPSVAKPFQDVRLVADVDRPAIMTRDILWRFRNGQWIRVDLPPGMGKGLPLSNFFLAEASLCDLQLLLFGEKLFVGIDRGEFGGGIWYLDLDTAERDWRKFDRGPAGSFAVGSDGTLWCSGGLMHMSEAYAGLYYYDGLVWQTLFEESGSIGEISPLFGRRSSINAICFDPDGSILYLLAPDAGIFRKEGDRIVPVVHLPEGNNSTEYATGLLVDKDETFYVADYDAGILVFNKDSGHYTVRSVRFPHPTTRPIHW